MNNEGLIVTVTTDQTCEQYHAESREDAERYVTAYLRLAKNPDAVEVAIEAPGGAS